MLPCVLLLFGIVYGQYRDARATAAQQVQEVARGTALALEHELHAIIASLEALAGSSSLDTGNLDAFRREAESLAWRHFPGASIALFDLNGEQILNTFAPPGQALPRRPNIDALERVKATGKPAISDLFFAPLQHTPIVPVDVPVFGPDGEVRAILSLAPPLSTFADIIERERPQPGWAVAVLDRNATIVARTPDAERYVGRQALAATRATLALSQEGTADMVTPDGTNTLTGWARPGPSGWSVAVGIPRTQLYAQAWRVALSVFAAFLVALLGALVLAGYVARRIARPVHALTQLARDGSSVAEHSTAKLTTAELTTLGLQEADMVAAALVAAMRERHDAEGRVREIEAEHRLQLEGRVAERTRELQSTQSQLLQAQRLEAVGQLTAGVAHDFNNLLQAMMAGLELLLDKVEEQDQARHYAEMALEMSQRGARLTHALLSFSRQQVLRPTAVTLPAVLDRLSELLTRTLDPRIAVEIAVGAGIGCPFVDLSHLEAALLNLCLNGRDAMHDAGGRLSVEAYAGAAAFDAPHTIDPAGCVVIAVSDEGCGMDDATLARACEPFFSTKGVGGGSGLGLPMAQGFAQQSGGDLRVQSAPGLGTRVELWLPQASAQSNAPASQAPAEASFDPVAPRQHSGRILLVDDDPSVLELLGDVLLDAGFDVVRATSGEQALGILQSPDQLDMLVTDYAMPGMTGGELVSHSRQLRPGLPAMVVTGFADQAQLGEVPVDTQVLHKPFRTADFIARVACLVAQSAAPAVPQAA